MCTHVYNAAVPEIKVSVCLCFEPRNPYSMCLEVEAAGGRVVLLMTCNLVFTCKVNVYCAC